MIRDFVVADSAPVRRLLVDEGWRDRARDADRFRTIVLAADRAVVAEIGGRVVGFGRAITDGVSNGYLSMLVVHPDHRRRGIGRAIVEALTGDDDRITWVLRAGHPGSAGFWEAIGFRRSQIAFERQRNR